MVTLFSDVYMHGSLTRYAKLRVAHAPGMPGTFFPPPWVSDPDMRHGTCVTHVPWCMPESLTSGFLWSQWRGNRSRHSRRMRNPKFLRVWQEVHCPSSMISIHCFEVFCPAGHDHGQDSCMPCAKGFYKVDGGFHQCTVCPEGSTTANTGSTSLSHCRDRKCQGQIEGFSEQRVPHIRYMLHLKFPLFAEIEYFLTECYIPDAFNSC